MYNSLLLSTIAISTISFVFTTIYIKDINNKIDKLSNLYSNKDSNITYIEWIKKKVNI